MHVLVYQDLQCICASSWIESFHRIHNFHLGFELLLASWTNIKKCGKLSVCTLQINLQQSTSLLHLEMTWLFFFLWEKSNILNLMSSLVINKKLWRVRHRNLNTLICSIMYMYVLILKEANYLVSMKNVTYNTFQLSTRQFILSPMQRSKLAFLKSRLLATLNCEMVTIKKFSPWKKKTWREGHFMTHYTSANEPNSMLFNTSLCHGKFTHSCWVSKRREGKREKQVMPPLVLWLNSSYYW